MEDFVAPDWSAPLDLQAALAPVPSNAAVKGFLLLTVLRQAKDAGVSIEYKLPDKVKAFHDYPIAEYMRLLYHAGTALHRGVSVREGIRRIGHRGYENFASSLVGKVIYGALGTGRDAAQTALRRVGRGYQVASSHAVRVEVVEEQADYAILELEDVWAFPDCYHVGLLEGACRSFGYQPAIEIRPHRPGRIDLRLNWRRA